MIVRLTMCFFTGRSFADIRNGVHLAYEKNGVTTNLIECTPFEYSYRKTSEITCRITRPVFAEPPIADLFETHLIVNVANDYKAKSEKTYKFVKPKITLIQPSKGPKSGGSLITIWGLHMNAGSKVEVLFGSRQCRVVHRDQSKIQCISAPKHETGPEKLVVKFDDGYRVSPDNQNEFLYLDDPVVTLVDSQPIKLAEPASSNLAAYNSDAYYSSFSNPQSAFLSSADQASAALDQSNYNHLLEKSRLMSNEFNQLPSLSLPYTMNGPPTGFPASYPTYQQYSARRSGQIKGIPSGGIDVYAAGYNFSVIAQPLIYVELNGTRYNSTCEILSDTQLKCKSPAVPANLFSFPNSLSTSLLGQTAADYVQLDFGFLMDEVRSVQDLSKRPNSPFEKFLMYKEPEVFLFHEEDNIRYLKSERLDISGRYFNGLLNSDNIYIQIGTATCNVTSIEPSRISCRPPPSQPKPLASATSLSYTSNYPYNKNLPNLPEVIVSFGGNRNITLGLLSYELPSGQISDIPKPLLYLILFSSLVLIIIVIIILIAYKRKSNESSRVLKTIQEQMDVLELRVAKGKLMNLLTICASHHASSF